MTTCGARLPLGERPRATVAPSGGVEFVQRRCGQSVGLVRVGAGFACTRRGHISDVLDQRDNNERGRRDADDDARALLAEKLRDEARDDEPDYRYDDDGACLSAVADYYEGRAVR